MNLSKHRLLQIIREEISTVREGAEDAFAALDREASKFDAQKKATAAAKPPATTTQPVTPPATAAPATTPPATAAPTTTPPATAAPATTPPAATAPPLSRAEAAFADFDAETAAAEKKYGDNYKVQTTSQTRESLEQTIREEIEAYLAEDDNSFSKAGEEIEKKGTEGVFTAKAKKAGMGVQAYADKVLAKDSKASTKTKRQAAFAKGAATVARENK